MSTVYKKFEGGDDLMNDSASEASSATVGRSPPSPSTSGLVLPQILKNRTLMLTSRGVSHRYPLFASIMTKSLTNECIEPATATS